MDQWFSGWEVPRMGPRLSGEGGSFTAGAMWTRHGIAKATSEA